MRGLVLAEKPSVMRAIKEVYGSLAKGYPDQLDFGAFHGHLMELKEPEDYNPLWADRRDTSFLPMLPDPFAYKAADVKAVNELLAKIKNGNYDFLVNACDAGREGEHIFWSFYETTGLTLPVKRFWTSSTTKPALKKALNDLRDSNLYSGMRQAAKYRAQFDYLVGTNFSRAASSGLRRFVPIGRVQSTVLKLIVTKEKEILAFKPEDFFEVKCSFDINGQSADFVHLVAPTRKDTRFQSKHDADVVAAETKAAGSGIVAGVKEDVRSTDAPTLYSLAELQKDANKYLKFKPDKTLAIAQKLYEAGVLSYPRSESRFLPTDMVGEIPAHLAVIASVPSLAGHVAKIGQAEIDQMLKKHYINDAGITDHHAVIPTDQAPNWTTLTKDEQSLYELVCKSFLAIFMPPYQVATSTILVKVGSDHIFKAQGRREVDKGYSVLYPSKKTKDVTLPACTKGDVAKVSKVTVSKGSTKPPQRYSPRTILAAMQNAGQDLPDSAMRSVLRESAGIGTSATRADILKKLEERGFVEVRDNAYYALEAGIRIIDNVGDRSFCSALLTAQWEEKLKAIEDGKYSGNFRQEMETYIKEETAYLLQNLKSTRGDVVGVCPKCGGDIVSTDKAFICVNRRKDDPSACTVWLSKSVGGYTLTPDDISELLAGAVIGPKPIIGRDGAPRNASFSLNLEKGLEFVNGEKTVVGTCPICGKHLIELGKAYVCEDRRKDDASSCQFWVPRVIGGSLVTKEDLDLLLSGQTTPARTITKKDSTSWNVVFFLDEAKAFQVKGVGAKTSIGPCPVCKKPVYAAANNFYCSGRSDKSCEWSFSRVIKGSKLEDKDMAAMLEGKKTRPIQFVWTSGKRGKARLFLSGTDLKWEFLQTK